MTTRICIAARKGGVGKTTIVAGLASLLSAKGLRVLAVDLDPQSNLAYMLGSNPSAPGTAALLLGLSPKPLAVTERLHVLPGGPDLTRRDIDRLDPEDLADYLEGAPYDVVLFDSPPGNEQLERLGMVASDAALVVTNAHPIAVVGANRVLVDLERRRKKERRGPSRWAIAMNMIDARRSLDREIEQIMGSMGNGAPRFKIKQDAKLLNATASGELLHEFAPNCHAAQAIDQLSRWCCGEK